MSAFTSTGALVRLALRRDRVQLPVWLIGITAVIGVTVQSVLQLYGTPQDWQAYATVNAANVVTRVANGPIGGATLGSVVIAESYFLLAVLVPMMSTFLVVRHTRQNEETGRAELIGAARVGRLASLTAALIVAVVANLVLGLLLTGVFSAGDLPISGAVLLSASVSGASIVFAAIAAVAAQIAPTARMANGLSVAAIAVAFGLRAAGDVAGDITSDGLKVISAWPTWCSPLGWISLVRAFDQDNWWLLGLFAAVFAGFTGLAFFLVTRRDVGFGFLSERRGSPVAGAGLRSTLGLAWRLQRGGFLGWLVGFVVMGFAVGTLGDQVDDLVGENLQMAEIIKQLGGAERFLDSFFAAMLALMGLAAAGYALQASLRMRAEETSGTLESLLATATGRIRWLFSHIFIAGAGAALLLVSAGATTGAGYALTANEGGEVARLAGAGLAYLPAVLVLIGFVVAVFGLLSRWTAGLAWGGLTVCLLLGQIGELLKLPQYLLNISPFTHVPAAPAVAVTLTPIVALTGVGAALLVIGAMAFRRRDILMP